MVLEIEFRGRIERFLVFWFFAKLEVNQLLLLYDKKKIASKSKQLLLINF